MSRKRPHRTMALAIFFFLIGVIIMSIFGQRSQPVIVNGIQIRSVRSDRPEFHRIYTASIDGGFTVKVEMRWFIGSRFDNSELTQRDGKYILFDARSVADKIIDRDLYPKVQKVVNEILRQDKAFIASNPDQYTDETGVTWKRIAQ